MVTADYYTELLRPVFAGRKVIVATDVMQGAAINVPALRAAGAQRPLLLAGTIGTGPLPPPEEAEQFALNLPPQGDTMAGIRAFEVALRNLPPRALAAVDAYDPDREAVILGSFFTRDGFVAGRRVYGGRTAAWEALEDKTVIDEVLAQAGIALAPTEVVSLSAVRDVANHLDAGSGTAWAGDSRDGWWGGATYFRWVRSAADAMEAEAFLGAACDRVRVMPFLEGIPCSIHGCVLDDVIALRPCEMITLRKVGRSELLYAGVATYWDPPDADREVMRDAARLVAVTLRDLFDYRGFFTLDGVLTADGFRPTELNPRPGAGMQPMAAAAGVNLMLLNKLIVEREPVDFRFPELEQLVVEASDAKRGGGCFAIFEGFKPDDRTVRIAKRDGRFAHALDEDQADGTVALGPSAIGGLVRYVPDATRLEPGASIAPTAVEVFAFTDKEFGTGLGPLESARSAR